MVSTDNPASWQTINRWMTTCLESHADCAPQQPLGGYRPTRLLQLEADDKYRLVHGFECPSALRYVALSHCWGNQSPDGLLRLLQSNLGQLGLSSPASQLPKTFRDAMRVTKHFGYQYLWIDRLCIIQDSREDWQREAHNMKNVYQNAVFSIAALGATDSSGGLFFHDRTMSLPLSAFPTDIYAKDWEHRPFRTFRASLDMREFDGFSIQEFSREPLVTRAWVLQERILSSRTIYFGTSQIYWECKTACCSEWSPDGIHETDMFPAAFDTQPLAPDDAPLETANISDLPGKPAAPVLWRNGIFGFSRLSYGRRAANKGVLRKELLDQPIRFFDERPRDQALLDWLAIVQLYCSLGLTMSNDKLVAISGIAKETRQRLESIQPGQYRYHAGLWDIDLLETLTWSMSSRGSRALEYRAPSWSWASVDGVVTFWKGLKSGSGVPLSRLSVIDSVRVINTTDDDTGEVLSGVLTLTGPCVTVDISMQKGDRCIGDIQQATNEARQVCYERHEGLASNQWFRANFDDPRDALKYSLHITVISSDFESSNQMMRRHGEGLLLERVSQDLYRRIGATSFTLPTAEELKEFLDGNDEKQVSII